MVASDVAVSVTSLILLLVEEAVEVDPSLCVVVLLPVLVELVLVVVVVDPGSEYVGTSSSKLVV